MEKERKKPKTKPRQSVPVELEPPPIPPTLSDFNIRQPQPSQAPVAPTVGVEQAPEPEQLPEEEDVFEDAKEVNNEKVEEKQKEVKEKENEKLAESRKSSKSAEAARTSAIFELPLEALIPRPAPAPVYPNLSELTSTRSSLSTPKVDVQVQPPSPVLTKPKLYPNLAQATAPLKHIVHSESKLLNEHQLLDYYQNDQLDLVDEYVDKFVEKELYSDNTLYSLLQKFKNVCEQLERLTEFKANLGRQLASTNNEVWDVQDHKICHSGRCGDDRNAQGEVYYKKAVLLPEKLVQLKSELDDLTRLELNESFCAEIRARSLALQIQWIILNVNNNFMASQQLNVSSVPTLVTNQRQNEPHRILLIGALSDLFYFTRFPLLPSRFRDSLSRWIVELTSVLLKSITSNDQQYLFCQILRCPSPIMPWAIPLVQTFIQIPSLDSSRVLDGFTTLLSLILQPIKRRNDFLTHFQRFYESDNGWNVVSEDGDSENTNLLELNDLDLVALLNQFSINGLFGAAIKHFTFLHQGSRSKVVLALISFVLMLLKLFNEGLKTYTGLKNVCKKVSDYLKKSITYVCTYWVLVKDDIPEGERVVIQNEINRIVLMAINHIISKKSMGLWQYLVDFPYSNVTEKCRLRALILLSNTKNYNVQKVFEIDDFKLEGIVKSLKLLEHVSEVSEEDSTFMISTLASIVAKCECLDIQFFVDELIEICFLDENTREKYYKAGSEAISVILDRKPSLLPSILKYINRRIDHLDNYAVDILTNASLSHCQIGVDDIGSILGKWLINRPIDHPASIIARRVLSALNWGSDPLFLSLDVHGVTADTIVKAHIVHCKNRNSLISKSVSKAAKMALRCPDLEQQFDRFCWDVLLKLKIQTKPLTNNPTSDLSAFFIFLKQRALTTPEAFLDSYLNYWVDLVNSGSFNAAIVILTQLVQQFPLRMHLFLANNSFRDAFERLIHADESSYAVQLLMGADKFPGPVLKVLSSAVANHLNSCTEKSKLQQAIDAWLQLMTCKKAIEWNQDKVVIYIIGILSRTAFSRDPSECFGLEKSLNKLYQALYTSWKDAPKGMLGWFSSQSPPYLIPSNLLAVSPWASYMCLRAEHKIYGPFYAALIQNLGKHKDRSLEESVKRAVTKSHIVLGPERLHFYRWLEFCTHTETIENPMYPLALQQLCNVMFKREAYEKTKFCPGSRYLSSTTAKELFDLLREKSLPMAEKEVENERIAGYIKAVSQWLFHKPLYETSFNNFGDLSMDYLVQMIISGDNHPWTEFVSVPNLQVETINEAKLYSTICYLNSSKTGRASPSPNDQPTTLTYFFQQLDSTSFDDTEPFPPVPSHPNLPLCESPNKATCSNSPIILSRFQHFLDDLTKGARTFIDCTEKVNKFNGDYLTEFQKLYIDKETTLIVSLKCGSILTSRCQKPGKSIATVQASHYENAIALSMNENRQERENEIGELLKKLDALSINCAQMEYMCWLLRNYVDQGSVKAYGFESKEATLLRQTGLNLFYRICNNVSADQMLFPALMLALENCMEMLGKGFLFENPAEQMNILRLVLSGNPLNIYITSHFSPYCVNSNELVKIYNELSSAVRLPASAEAGLSLMNRIDFQKAGLLLPPEEFAALLPVIFQNMTSVTVATPLHSLCVSHFQTTMFHNYPQNVATGYRLMLSGIDSQCVPISLFENLAQRFQIHDFLRRTETSVNTDSKFPIELELARECLLATSDQLKKSRQEQLTKLYSIWTQSGSFLDFICTFAEFFIKIIVCHNFRSDSPPSLMEKELRELFLVTLSVWGPLLEPVSTASLPPWNPSDSQIADQSVVQKFVQVLIWLPHSTYLPPGSETVETLVWQYFANKLSQLQRAGTSHIFSVYEQRFLGFNWARFWPTLLDLSAFEKILTEASPDASALITDILVRVQWPNIIQMQQNQPLDAHRAFHSLLLVIFSRCSYRQQNYAKSRASIDKLLRDFLNFGNWYYTKLDAIEKTANFISTSFPPDTLTNPTDVSISFFNIWREVCFFSTSKSFVPSNSVDWEPELIAKKQAAYVRVDTNLLLRSNMSQEDQSKHYRELIDKVYLMIGGTKDFKPFNHVAIELISFWLHIPKDKKTAAMFNVLVSWLNDRPDSCLLLLILQVTMPALGKGAPQLGLKLLDQTIKAYFKRRFSCDWSEACQWISMPDQLKEWLYTTPSSDTEPRFLALNAHLRVEMSQLKSVDEEAKLLKRLADYLNSVKPKYIAFEPAFVLCLEKWQRLVIRQYSHGISPTVANQQFEQYLEFLRKVYSEDKSVSIFNVKAMFSKKPSYPLKIQLIAHLLHLYLQQQQLGPNQKPRLESGQMIFNSRQTAYRDLRKEKQFAEIQNIDAFHQEAHSYFTQPEAFNLLSAGQLFSRCIHHLYPDNQKLFHSLD